MLETQMPSSLVTKRFYQRTKFRVIFVAVIFTMVTAAILYVTWPHWIRRTFRAYVTDKQRIMQGTESLYLVFTKDEHGKVHVFKNIDSKLELKWNSSDIQGELEVGKTYDIKTYGIRFPMTSSYPNITKVKQVQK